MFETLKLEKQQKKHTTDTTHTTNMVRTKLFAQNIVAQSRKRFRTKCVEPMFQATLPDLTNSIIPVAP